MDLVPIIPNSSSMRVPCQSTKAISQSNWFIYLGKSFETIPKEHEIEPTLGWSNGHCGCLSMTRSYGGKVRIYTF